MYSTLSNNIITGTIYDFNDMIGDSFVLLRQGIKPASVHRLWLQRCPHMDTAYVTTLVFDGCGEVMQIELIMGYTINNDT